MARIYIFSGLCCIALGAYMGWMLKPSSDKPAPTQNETKQAQVKVVTRTVVKTVKPDGTVIERSTETTRDKNVSTKSTNPDMSPKLEYRVGAQTGLDLKPTFTTGRRLLGNLWLDGSFKPSSKDLTLGLSYEF